MHNLQISSVKTLSDDQAATVTGGIKITSIKCDYSNESTSEPYLTLNDKEVWRGSLREGQTSKLNISANPGNLLELFESDPWPNPDDDLGNRIVPKSPGTTSFSNSNSKYTVTFA